MNSIKINSRRRANSYLYTEKSKARDGWSEAAKEGGWPIRGASKYEVNKGLGAGKQRARLCAKACALENRGP